MHYKWILSLGALVLLLNTIPPASARPGGVPRQGCDHPACPDNVAAQECPDNDAVPGPPALAAPVRHIKRAPTMSHGLTVEPRRWCDQSRVLRLWPDLAWPEHGEPKRAPTSVRPSGVPRQHGLTGVPRQGRGCRTPGPLRLPCTILLDSGATNPACPDDAVGSGVARQGAVDRTLASTTVTRTPCGRAKQVPFFQIGVLTRKRCIF